MWRVSLAWGMMYVLRQGMDVALIDCGLQKDRADVLTALDELHITPDRVRTVLLTHAHTDHAGNAAFFAAHGAEIITHAQEAPFLQPPRRSYAYRGLHALRRPFTSLAFTIGERLFPVERCRVTRTVEDGETIQAGGSLLQVIATPGHTPGHISFWREQDGLLFSGDALLNIIPVRRETGLSLPMRLLSDDWPQTIRSARRLADLPTRVLLAGHGVPVRDMTAVRIREFVQRL